VKSSNELRCCAISSILFRMYQFRRLQRLCIAAARRFEGGNFYSETLRRILSNYHGVDVGAYSYGECMIPGSFPRGVVVGRYVSIGPGVRVFLRNHPMERLSLHPFFYNRYLGYVKQDTISTGNLEICHDAWIGAHAILTPKCSRIGIGAVVGAGTVVTKNVEDFAIVVGNPGRQIGSRFPEKTCEIIRQSRWWELSILDCAEYLPEMIRPLGDDPHSHPLLRVAGSRPGTRS
jgi:virginiamycin A acetyltransferase